MLRIASRQLLTNPLAQRLAGGLAANAVGKFWVILVQILTVPVLVSKWGASGYGTWLMLTAVPSYVALSDLGFGMAAAADMTHRVTLGDRRGALRAFQSVWVFITIVSAIIAVVTVPSLFLFSHLLFHSATRQRIALIEAMLVFYALTTLQMNVMNIAYRSSGLYARGTFLMDLLYPLEAGLIMGAALLNHGAETAALLMMLVRLTGLVIYYQLLRRLLPWINVGFRQASLGEIRTLAKPAFAALMLPLSTALNIQGVIFLIGLFVSPAAAGMFGTIRTVTRFPLQIVGILSRASVPEITASYASRDYRRLSLLARANLGTCALITLPTSVGLIFLGATAVRLLTHGRITVPQDIIVPMTLVMIAQTTWNTAAVFLLALNQQGRFSHTYLFLSLLAMIGPLLASRFGTPALCWLLLLVDLAMCCVVLRAWRLATGLPLSNMLTSRWHGGQRFAKPPAPAS